MRVLFSVMVAILTVGSVAGAASIDEPSVGSAVRKADDRSAMPPPPDAPFDLMRELGLSDNADEGHQARRPAARVPSFGLSFEGKPPTQLESLLFRR